MTRSRLEQDLDRALPMLIVENNLHGVDIDPRAAQIAALALWLRAQRAWREAGIEAPTDRPSTEPHIVIAEPMPGDAEHAARSSPADLDPPLLGDLFRQIVASMSLAGEMGTLLRAEAELADEIGRARAEFVSQRMRPRHCLASTCQVSRVSSTSPASTTTRSSSRPSNVSSTHCTTTRAAVRGAQAARRRLFADDAGQGVALLELLRQRYDVVLMNPPFGAGSLTAKRDFESATRERRMTSTLPSSSEALSFLMPRGMLGAITSRTGFFLSSFQKWREEIMLEKGATPSLRRSWVSACWTVPWLRSRRTVWRVKR